MNKAFKVLWNQVRGTYVVASEAQVTHGKPGKATKTIVAAAVAGLLAAGGSAFAATEITNDSFGSGENQYDSTKFISGHGGEISIETEGSAGILMGAIASGNLENVLDALGTPKDPITGTQYVTLAGFAGGENFIDTRTNQFATGILFTNEFKALLGYFKPELPDAVNKIERSWDNFKVIEKDETITQDIHLTLGTDSTPLLVASVLGDRVINTGMTYIDIEGQDTFNGSFVYNVKRNGNIVLDMHNGNSILMTGAGSAINVSGLGALGFVAQAESTSYELNGNTTLNLLDETTSALTLVGGSAVALGGNASSTVTGSSTINVNTQTSSDGYAGITAGVIAGGTAVSTWGGKANASVTDTIVNLTSGATLGIVGSGAAINAESSFVTDYVLASLGNLSDAVTFENTKAGGTSTSTVTTATVNVGKSASAFGLMGGGLAAAAQMYDSTEPSVSKTSTEVVNLNIGEVGAGYAFANNDDKVNFHYAVVDAGEAVMGYVDALRQKLDGAENVTLPSEYDIITKIVDAIDVSNVTVGVLGGGMALSYQANNGSSAEERSTTSYAENKVGTVNIDVNSGYNVGIFGSGLAASSAAEQDGEHLNALSDVGTVNIGITGGETVGVMGGGISYFTGTNEPNNGVSAQAKTETVNILVETDPKNGNQVASVDGIVGGGLAIDDTNGQYTNVSSEVGTVNIKINSGKVNKLYYGWLGGASQPSGERPADLKDYWDSITYAMTQGSTAVIGGGIASGGSVEGKHSASVGTVDIRIGDGATIGEAESVGNIFGGGLATDGASTYVKNVNITVNGEKAVVNGDIYGGGIALDGQYEQSYVNTSKSTVDNVQITLNNGSVTGNVYVGGKVIDSDNVSALTEGTSSTVKTATVNLNSDKVLGETSVVDGSGAETSTLKIASETGSFKFSDEQGVRGFDVIESKAAVSNMSYDFGNRKETVVTGGPVEFVSFGEVVGNKTLVVGNDAGETKVAGFASVAEGVNIAGMTFSVDTGLLSFNETGANAIEIATSTPAQAVATVYMTGNVDLTNTTVLVGETDNTTPGLYMGANGLLIADAAAKTNVTTGTDQTQTAEGAIHFVGVAEDGATVKIAAAEETATTVDNVLYKSIWDKTGYTFEARTGDELAEVGLYNFDAPDFLSDLHNHDNKGARFIERFLDQATVGVTNENRTQQLNAAVNLATAAGVQTAAIDSASLGIDAANKRASIINDQHEGGVLFAEASGRRTEMGGSADFGAIKSELGGVVVGGEYTTGDWTFGALANVGTGSVKGEGDNAGVDNDVDYYGAQIYTGKRFGQFNVVGQVGYLATSNEISHSTVALNKADVDADVITVGVRGEMRFDVTENTRMVPYIGLNYLRVGTDGYTTSQGVQVGDVDQNLFTLPVGVKYAGDMETTSGWMWTPSVDVAYVAAFGDRDVEATTHVGAVGQTTMDVWAESVVRTTIGVKAQKDNFGFGVEAGGAFGSDDTQGLFGQVRVDYRF